MSAPVPVLSYSTDWMPYRRSNAFYRTLDALSPQDWSGTALTNKTNDSSRFVEIAANLKSTWTPVTGSAGCEVLALLYLVPGLYGTTVVSANTAYGVRINTTTGNVDVGVLGSFNSAGALPAAVWTSSSVYTSCWVRMQVAANGKSVQARVWAVGTAEPGTWPYTGSDPAGAPSAWAPALGWASGTALSACKWFAYGSLNAITSPRMLADVNYFETWFKTAGSQGATRAVTAEIFIPAWDGTITTAYTTAALRVATVGYDGGNAWPLNNQPFAEGLLEWPTFARKLPDELFGRQDFTVGDLVVANPNGIRDDWLRAKMQNSIVVLRYGDPSWPWFDQKPIFVGVVTDTIEGAAVIRLKLRDAAGRFDKAVHRTTLTTSNASNGKPTPISAGRVFNVSPVQIDAATLTYRFGEANVIALTQVRDRGVALTTYVITAQTFDPTADTLTSLLAHGLAVGEAVVVDGVVPSPLTVATTYYVKTVPSIYAVTLAATLGGATIDLTGTDTTSKTITTIFPQGKLLRCTAAHGFSANMPVRFGGTMPTGLASTITYYVLATGLTSTDFSVSLTVGGAAVAFTGDSQTIGAVGGTNEVAFASGMAHGWAVNDRVTAEGTVPANLTAPSIVYIKTVPLPFQATFSATAGGAVITLVAATTGALITKQAFSFTVARFIETTLTAAAYTTDLTAATFKLKANPAGQITCDFDGQKFNGASAITGYHALGVLIGQRDPVVSVDSTDVQGLNRNVGIWLDSTANLVDLFDLLARSVTAVWGVTRQGALSFYVAGSAFDFTPVRQIVPDDVILPDTLMLQSKKLPVGYNDSVRVLHTKNYTVQKDSDLAGAVTVANRAIYGAEGTIKVMNAGFTPASSLDDGTKGELRKLPLIETCVLSDTDAQWAGQSKLIASTKQLGIFSVTVRWVALDQFRLGVPVTVKIGRYGINPSTGQSMVVIGMDEDIKTHTVKLLLLAEIATYYPVTT